MRSSKIIILILVVLALTGCGGGGGGGTQPVLLSLAITPANPTVASGLSQQFTAIGTFTGNTTQNMTAQVAWRSTNTGVATINSAGAATAAAIGTTRIKAVFGNISTATNLTVATAALISIAVTPPNPTIAIGSTQQFTATGSLQDSTTINLTPSVTWNSSNTRVAMITTTGLATPLAAGTSTITATSGSIPGSTTMTVPVPPDGNVLPVTVNGSLCTNYPGIIYPNKPCVSVTVCTPGTSTCQTINDILLDTGSYGLRVFKQALTVTLNQVTVPAGSLAECVRFVDGSAEWGPVQSADVVLGGEPAVTVPIQVIDATFGTPAVCGSPLATPAAAGYNGILGVGLFAEDCGSGCETAIVGRYYACSGSSCSGTLVQVPSQVQNPVAHLPLDNNGVLVQLPGVPAGGAPSVNGQLMLGIGTRTNNTPSGVTAFPASPTTGDFVTIYNGVMSSSSFIDSGSNGLFFTDSAIPTCSGWYCPPSPLNLSVVTEGYTGTPSAPVSFQIGNAISLFNSGNLVFSELGGNLGFDGFDLGLPFFYGRGVFVGIDGRGGSSLGIGPFWAY